MKAVNRAITLFLFVIVPGVGEIRDPTADYLSRALRENGDLNEAYYSDDKVARINLDINGDGISETFVSLLRDSMGKEGNNWMAYRKVGELYEPLGRIVFNSSRFYLGPIDEIGQYGLVNFGPSGAGEGNLTAYIYDGDAILTKALGEVARDRQTNQLKGEELLEKYLSNKAVIGDRVTMETRAPDFGREYGLRIELITHRESVLQSQAKREAAIRDAGKEPIKPGIAPVALKPAPSPSFGASDPASATKATDGGDSESLPWPWRLAIVALVLLLGVLWAKRR